MKRILIILLIPVIILIITPFILFPFLAINEPSGAKVAVVEGWMGLSHAQFEVPIDFIHKKGGATVVWMLIVGHAGAALYHHYALRDRTLIKMTTG